MPEDAGAVVGTVLERTTYYTWYAAAKARVWNARGFAFVLQDQRGTGNSRSTPGASDSFQFWRLDGQDAYDAMEWIAAQPWSNQRVYEEGLSAMGIAVYASGLLQPPWLPVIAPATATADGYVTAYQGGAFRQSLLGTWLSIFRFGYVIDEIFLHEGRDAWWDPISLPGKEERCTYGGIHLTGWWDLYSKRQH